MTFFIFNSLPFILVITIIIAIQLFVIAGLWFNHHHHHHRVFLPPPPTAASTATTATTIATILIDNQEIVSLLFELISMPQHHLVDMDNPRGREYGNKIMQRIM